MDYKGKRMWNALKLIVASILFISFPSFLFAQSRHNDEKRGCPDAQILDIEGEWVASSHERPLERPLAKWSCVANGEELAPRKSARSGRITVIYYRGNKQPDTVICRSRESCRNTYRVEIIDEPHKESSPFAELRHFFSSFFESGEPKLAPPGILKGPATPQTAVLCRTGDGTIDLAPALRGEPGIYKVLLKPLEISAHNLRWESGPAFITDPLNHPTLYELELRDSDNLSQGSTIVLVAGKPVCEALARSFQLAVQWTETWPHNTSGEAIRNFLAVYLQAIAHDPDRAPQEKE
jgi:hypothetical protein